MTAALLVLTLLTASPAPADGAPPPAAATGDAKARAWFTDTELVTHEGTSVRFYRDVLQGRVVLIGFIFTRCAGACPIIMSKLGRVKAGLAERFGEDVRFVLLTVDPEFDTPQQIRRFAEDHRATAAGWTYLTGKKESVSLVLSRLGAAVTEPGDHNTGFLAANVRTQHWIKVQPQTPPGAIVEQLSRLVAEDRAGGAAAAAR
jgi:cytochrome oxidase Cu insertion factor (SCO1/SenC/PrrC family)